MQNKHGFRLKKKELKDQKSWFSMNETIECPKHLNSVNEHHVFPGGFCDKELLQLFKKN